MDGQTLTEEERCSAARARFGKGKTAADWIPRDCHMSNAARVCPPVQPRQSNPAPRSAPTCPTSLFGGAPTRGRDAPLRLAGGKLLRIHLMQRRGAVRGCRGHHREHAGHVQPHAQVLRENSETPAGLSLIYQYRTCTINNN